jgi:hypothetical protein
MAAPLLDPLRDEPEIHGQLRRLDRRPALFMLKPTDAAPRPEQINIVLNWFEELKQRVPKDRNGTAWMHGFD